MSLQQHFSRPRCWPLLAGALLLGCGQLGWAADVSYLVVPGKAVADNNSTDVTLLLEQPTGRTWVLTKRGNATPAWQPVPYGEGQGLTTMTMPPPAPNAE